MAGVGLNFDCRRRKKAKKNMGNLKIQNKVGAAPPVGIFNAE